MTNQRIEIPEARILHPERGIEALHERWGHSPILAAFEIWKQGGTPGFIIDRSSDDPMFYRTLNHEGKLADRWPSKMMKDFPLREHAKHCALEYEACRKPTFHYLKWREGKFSREYLRALLPLVDGRLSCIVRSIGSPSSLPPPVPAGEAHGG